MEIPFPPHILSSLENYTGDRCQKLSSSRVYQCTSLGVGVVRDGALHITPLNEVLQVRVGGDSVGRIKFLHVMLKTTNLDACIDFVCARIYMPYRWDRRWKIFRRAGRLLNRCRTRTMKTTAPKKAKRYCSRYIWSGKKRIEPNLR